MLVFELKRPINECENVHNDFSIFIYEAVLLHTSKIVNQEFKHCDDNIFHVLIKTDLELHNVMTIMTL